jgi:mono/diheme cytochrome c family protein
MTRRTWTFAFVAGVMVAWLAGGLSARVGRQDLPAAVGTNPIRLAQMQHHFTQIALIHQSIIRGDLGSIRKPALELVALPTPNAIPAAAEFHVASIRAAARTAADATTLADAAASTVRMLMQCSECHRQVGVGVVPNVGRTPDVGGMVGHMLDHQRAADDMLLGLLIPSPSQWRDGAQRLSVAALKTAELPVDPALTKDVKKAEDRVHELAKKAQSAADANARAAIYTQLISECAQCHVAHARIWGPGTGTR